MEHLSIACWVQHYRLVSEVKCVVQEVLQVVVAVTVTSSNETLALRRCLNFELPLQVVKPLRWLLSHALVQSGQLEL